MNTISRLFAAGALLFAGSQAQAIMVTNWDHDSGSTAADYTLSITESMGRFDFMLSVDMGFTADLLALGLNGPDYDATNLDAMGTDITGFFFDTNSCGMGCNFNADIDPGSFDVIIRFGTQGMGGGGLLSTSFSIAANGFSLDDFTDFGVRSQTSGVAGCVKDDDDEEVVALLSVRPTCGSDKAFGAVTSVPVPESGALAMLGLGLLGLGFVGRVRRA